MREKDSYPGVVEKGLQSEKLNNNNNKPTQRK